MISIRKIGVMGRTYRHAKRYQETLNVLIKYGFGDLVDALNIKQNIEIGIENISGEQPERIEKLSRPERVRLALGELGPTFIKLEPCWGRCPRLVYRSPPGIKGRQCRGMPGARSAPLQRA